jgi:hypothetical protein
MGLFHVATITPSKEDLIANWAPSQPWGPAPGSTMEFVGAFRFDDPEGCVGMETFVAIADGELFQIPLTYRDAPLEGADDALISTMDHSALGKRWVYDGLGDPRFVVMMAAVAMTGQGEALGMARHESRWYIAPAKVRIQGGGWARGPVPVDGFVHEQDDDVSVTLANDRFELKVFRRPRYGSRPPIGLTATWLDQPNPVVLAEVRERPASS